MMLLRVGSIARLPQFYSDSEIVNCFRIDLSPPIRAGIPLRYSRDDDCYSSVILGFVILSGVEGLSGESLLIELAFVNKPGRSGSPRLQFGAIADNGTAVSETLLNVHFQIGHLIFYFNHFPLVFQLWSFSIPTQSAA